MAILPVKNYKSPFFPGGILGFVFDEYNNFLLRLGRLGIIPLVGLGGQFPNFCPVAPIANATTGISSIAALVTGLVSMIKSKERSILVYLGMGLLVLLFLLGEFLFPH